MKGATGVHLIVGGKDFDSYLAEEALEATLAEAVGPDRQSAVQLFRGDETTWARVLDAARTRSLFAQRSAVVVRNAEGLKGDDSGVADYLEDPTPGLALVLVGKVDRRKAVWKRLSDGARVFKAEPLRGQALKAYVRQALRRRKLALGEDAIAELIERVGQDLRRLMGELEKLAAFGFGEAALGADLVALVLGRGMARPLYELSDAFVARDAARSLELIGELLEEREPPLKVLAVLHRGLRQLKAARALKADRVPREQMLDRLDMQRFAFKLPVLLEAAGRWSEADLAVAFRALDKADRAIKTSLDGGVALAAATAEACGGKALRPSGRGR